MAFFPIQPLESKAILKIVTMLWNQEAVKILLVRLNLKDMDLDDMPRDWKALENVVIKSVKYLYLPKSLENKALSVIIPIGLEILRWNNFHNRYLTKVSIERKEVTSKLIWSSDGTINRKQTARNLVQKPYLDISRRYALACAYCFEKYILVLFKKIPSSKMKYFYVEGNPKEVNQDIFVVYWTYRLKGELNKMNVFIDGSIPGCTLDEYMFYMSVKNGNIEATKYFLHRVPEDKRQAFLTKVVARFIDKFDFTSRVSDRAFIKLKKYSKSRREEFGVLFYLFSELTKNEQMDILEINNNKLFILVTFLVWPYKNIFIDTIKKLHSEQRFEIDFSGLFQSILRMLWKETYTNDQELFREFWQLMPKYEKVTVIKKLEDEKGALFFETLLDFTDCETLWTILKDASVKQRENILFNKKSALINLISNGEWQKLRLYIQLCISSKNIFTIFKETMNRDKIDMFKNIEDKESKQNQFFELLGDLQYE